MTLKWTFPDAAVGVTELDGVYVYQMCFRGVRFMRFEVPIQGSYQWAMPETFVPLDDNIIAVAQEVKCALASVDKFIDGRWPREDP